jgi:phosphofructokinase-like protein
MKIAVNTGGGDAPGLNAVIRAVTMAGHSRGWTVEGLRFGYQSLFDPDDAPPMPLTPDVVKDITKVGGTILGAINKGNPFEYPVRQPDGSYKAVDRSDELIEQFRRMGFDALVAIGGDGSLSIADKLGAKGVPVVGVPKTIDNDLVATWRTFGFDTAVHNATDIIDKLHTTAKAHQRTFVVEVMGRDAGWIALYSGIAGDADVIMIPEIRFNYNRIYEKIRACYESGKNYAIVVVAEAAKAASRNTVVLSPREIGRARRLGGVGTQIAEEIAEHTGVETRVMVCGHVQRGGAPTNFDRILALRYGGAAVRAIASGETGVMISYQPPNMGTVPLAEVGGKIKRIDLGIDTITTARELGICLGD